MNKLSATIRVPLMTFAFGRVIKFAATAKVRIDQLEFHQSTLTLKNRRRVQNHIGSVHAAATALLGESATGYLLGLHVSDDKIPLLKSMHIDYVKRSTGDLKAVATLTSEQINHVRTSDKGDVVVKVIITDEQHLNPVECEYTWAWVPKRK